MNVVDVILSGADDAAIALIQGEEFVTYCELRQKVAHLADWLAARGHKKGDRVGILAENSPFFVIAYLAVIRAGLVVVPFQTEISAETWDKIITDAGIQEVFVSKQYLKRARVWAERSRALLLTESGLQDNIGKRAMRMPEIDPVQDLAALMFTSGSTGSPKGVMVTHRNIECNTRDIISYLGLTPTDRVMVVLPFHYCYGASLLHTHLMVGGTLVLNNEFMYPEAVLQEMQQQTCTGFAGVPSTYQILLRKSRFGDFSFPHLRWFQQAGGRLANPFIIEIRKAFPHIPYYLMYGQTEATARLSYLPPERLADKLGSIGTGLPSTRLEVLHPNGTPVTAGSDEVGEIVASGENITLGYWNDPEETAKYFRNGKLFTGDLARVDADGFIYIVEREREMIKCGGKRVGAKEVEEIIAELPSVVETAVIGVPHDLLGEAIMAFVVRTAGADITANHIIEHCKRRLPAFKVPEFVTFISALPHNSSGKVVKRALADMVVCRVPNGAIL